MDDPWLIVMSAAAGAGVAFSELSSPTFLLMGQRRAQTTYQIVQAQHLVIEDLQAAFERVTEGPALKEWISRSPELP